MSTTHARDDSSSSFLQLVADPHRWFLLRELARSDRRVGELTALAGSPQNLVSYHLGQLRTAGLVSARRSSADRRDTYYRLDLARCRDLLVGAGAALHPGLQLAWQPTAPADVPPAVLRDAVELARQVLERLDVVGVLCVEMFLLRDGRLLVNELAPRPHNSGHLTVDAAVTSQFEQQLRAICGLPLGSTELVAPAAMANLLGDLWRDGQSPSWTRALADPAVKLHLYGKLAARPGRKANPGI